MKTIAVIGGSGFENISGLSFCGEKDVNTIYGKPSAPLKVYKTDNVLLYNLARHGINHQFAPHTINYRANIKALKELGVDEIISFSAVGGINETYRCGDFVLTSDAIDTTSGRINTFYDKEGDVIHIDMSNPFCPSLRKVLIDSAINCGVKLIDNGVYVCTNGPRFETPAEIKMYRMWGADMVGMTLFPELTLAKELGMCYANISLVTNAASGVEDNKKLTSEEVMAEAKNNNEKVKNIIEKFISNMNRYECGCQTILKGAGISK